MFSGLHCKLDLFIYLSTTFSLFYLLRWREVSWEGWPVELYIASLAEANAVAQSTQHLRPEGVKL